MTKFFAGFLVISGFILSCSQVKKMQQPERVPTAIPDLRVLNDTSAMAIKITSLNIDVTVAANIATTTFDIIFYNPNDRILVGEFEFPLTEEQHIVRYALDIEGKLREGVVVEKAKARMAFENTVRRQVDPGLVEKTKGNNFRTRIYPLPARGQRHILIAVEQMLSQDNNSSQYYLPLFADQPIGDFSLKTTVIKSDASPELEKSSLSNFDFKKWQQAWVASYHEKNFIANHTIAFSIPRSSSNETTVLTERSEGQTYFFVNSYLEKKYQSKKEPASVGILWDISASGEKRNLVKEQQLLKEYLSKFSNVKVSLIPFNVFVQDKEDFIISNGNSDLLLASIQKLNYDGGTQLGSLDLTRYSFEEILLFSDGLSNFGKKEVLFSNSPVIVINSSPSADFSLLRFIAQRSHGKFIDLGNTATSIAADEINQQSLQIIGADYDHSEIDELVLPVSGNVNSGISFAGKLKAARANIKISLGFGEKIVLTKLFTVEQPDSTEYDQVKRIWATMKMNELDLQFAKNKDVITTLGKKFSIVTQNTSLLVLDRVEDYVEQEIIPPFELQKDYYSLLEKKNAEKNNEKETAMMAALESMKELKDWWNTNFAPGKGSPSILPNTVYEDLGAARIESINHDGVAELALGSVDSVSSSSNFTMPQDSRVESPPANQVTFDKLAIADDQITEDQAKEREEEKNAPPLHEVVIIAIKEWKPDAPYLSVLEKTSIENRIITYYGLKKQYGSQPSFFIDVARFFIEKNERRFGIQVLSNVAEMKLEDASLLRMVANQLMDAGETILAVETYKDILSMREEEPQSYRDLALACNETGKYQEAVELLYKLILGNWHDRFSGLQSIALNEMNSIISAHKKMLNISTIDSRLIYSMPVDVRIVISWNTDDSDMDLWVSDPKNEKCSYQNTRTTIGGRISNDITQGYGPEEFSLKKAINGEYSVEANLFGDSRQTLGGAIAIKADLFTNFGKSNQKKQTINFRVDTAKEVVHIGLLKFKS